MRGSAAARTSEAQSGEGSVILERGGQRRGPIGTDLVAGSIGCGTSCARGCKRVQARTWQCGGVKSAAARTSEVQRGEGRVLLERGGHRRSPIITDAVACNTRGLRNCARAQARVARA